MWKISAQRTKKMHEKKVFPGEEKFVLFGSFMVKKIRHESKNNLFLNNNCNVSKRMTM